MKTPMRGNDYWNRNSCGGHRLAIGGVSSGEDGGERDSGWG